MGTRNDDLRAWVSRTAARTPPEGIHWCDGSDEGNAVLIREMLATETLRPFNQETHPRCYLHRSAENDVARVEHLTFICTPDPEDAGPNNHWMSRQDAHAKL